MTSILALISILTVASAILNLIARPEGFLGNLIQLILVAAMIVATAKVLADRPERPEPPPEPPL